MKTTSILKAALAIVAAGCFAQANAQVPIMQSITTTDTVAVGVDFSDISMKRTGDNMVVSMDMNLADTKMKGDRVIVYRPVIVNGDDSLKLNPVGLYSHVRWIQYMRNDNKPVGGSGEESYLFKKRPASIQYSETVPYEKWMNGAELVLERCDYGCCSNLISQEDVNLARWRELAYEPAFKYMRPIADPNKHRELEGSAFIDFPVDQTIIYPDYRNNTFWLDSIRGTIDLVRNDPDATIESVSLKGFASPESPYRHNTDLAKGRTAALKKYIQNLYNFKGVEIYTDYEPEDWDGLRKAVEKSNLPHRTEILALIDTDMNPDAKEARIKQLYPQDYEYMHTNFYPPLRHTEYKVTYFVRNYDDPVEILQVMRTRPANLSLDEFYIAAASLEPGSDEYNEVFETAVRMYPTDETANLNAANTAMQRGDYAAAQRYLEKAGNTAEANYARAVLNTLQRNYTEANKYLNTALGQGLQIDPEELTQIQEVIRYAPVK